MESGRCAICSRAIESDKEKRVLRSTEKVYVVHGKCLTRLRRLACDMDGRIPPIPTLTRSLTLHEFLLTKRPKTGSEILSCVVYFFQVQHIGDEVLTVDCIKNHLRYSPYKITNIQEAADHAIDLGLIGHLTLKDTTHYIITAKGRKTVERLPLTSK